MTVTEPALDDLRKSLAGRLTTPGEPAYDTSRSLFNGMVDKRPAAVVLPSSAADVAAAVRFAGGRDLPIGIRGGGHGYAGACIPQDGLMIDLSPLNTVTVDPEARRARVGGGARLSDLDAATQAHGLAVTSGQITHTGIGGLTLGGGIGWLTNHAGLSIDNLLSAEVVLADGSIVRASADSHPDLFWALRGGGGNFGAVTEFEFALHPIGPLVNVALFFWGVGDAAAAIAAGRDLAATLPRSFGMQTIAGLNAPPLPFVPPEHHFALGVAVVIVGFGTADEHADLIAPVRAALPPLFEMVTPMPYVALQSMIDEAAPWGIKAYSKGLFLREFGDDAVQTLASYLPKKTSPMSLCPMFPLNGAFHDVPDEATAFAGSRDSVIAIGIEAVAPDEALVEADRLWVRELHEALVPYAAGAAGYVNFLAECDQDLVRAAYGEAKYDRLAAIKSTYDPGNVFRPLSNILPAG